MRQTKRRWPSFCAWRRRGSASKKCSKPPRAQQAWDMLKSVVGWAGILTSRFRFWHCGFCSKNANAWGKKAPALTVQQTRFLFAKLLRKNPPSITQIAQASTSVLRRNVEERIYAWQSATGSFPPLLRCKITDEPLQ